MAHNTITLDYTDSKNMMGRVIGSALLFFGLSWLTLNVYAQPFSEVAPVTIATPVSHTGTTSSVPIVTLEDTAQVFTLTVLNSNDTWGYLDPCG